jgi:nitrite reductase/ring-hydroxylating ferredoxin subunit
MKTFARPSIVRQGWYLVGSSRKLAPGRVQDVELGSRRLVLYRDDEGRAHAVADRCPHLGSDLALAHIAPHGLRCEFHGWCWSADGQCVEAPGNSQLPMDRRVRAGRRGARALCGIRGAAAGVVSEPRPGPLRSALLFASTYAFPAIGFPLVT